MSEQRLIDANEIVKVAEHAYNEWNLAMAAAEGTQQINHVFKMQELCKTVKAVAKAVPTVDAVEVVRCKDCVHSWESCCGLRCSWLESCDGDLLVADDDYCSYGERRNSDERTLVD